MTSHQNPRAGGGFTLVELLVVIAIVAVLVVLSVAGSKRFIDNGKKVQAMTQFRQLQVGFSAFELDYTKPPIPASKRSDTEYTDTVYGDPGGLYGNEYLISVLAGSDKEYPMKTSETFSAKESNPRQEAYTTFPFVADKKNGVGDDGKLYDPWGGEMIMAINGMAAPGATLNTTAQGNKGKNDQVLYTWGLGEYKETKPKFQTAVFWSYGKDKKKGNSAPNVGDVVPLSGSDDVVSWQ